MSETEDTILTERQLQKITDEIEKAIIRKYKNIFIGVISGIVVIFTILTYVGIDSIKLSLANKVAEKIASSQFKNKVAVEVTAEITALVKSTTAEINLKKERSDTLLKEIESNHADILDAASNEFSRTIDVLKRVRSNVRSSAKSNNEN